MKITILDAHTLNPGDLSWDSFAEFGDVEVFQSSSKTEALERAKKSDVVIVNKVIIDQEFLDSCDQLKYVGVTATGYNNVDIEAAQAKNVTVTNVTGYSTDSVAQYVFSQILNFSCKLYPHVESVSKGDWQKSEHFSYYLEPLHELKGKTLGIVGLGNIGQAVAKLAEAFRMNIIASKYHSAPRLVGIELVELEELFRRSDFITLHCPQTKDTDQFLNSDLLSKMKKTAFLLNAARGGLVNEQNLADALNQEQIAGAGLDVLSTEPPQADNPLLNAKNCYITPHIAWASRQARLRLMEQAFLNLKAFLDGKPVNVVK